MNGKFSFLYDEDADLYDVRAPRRLQGRFCELYESVDRRVCRNRLRYTTACRCVTLLRPDKASGKAFSIDHSLTKTTQKLTPMHCLSSASFLFGLAQKRYSGARSCTAVSRAKRLPGQQCMYALLVPASSQEFSHLRCTTCRCSEFPREESHTKFQGAEIRIQPAERAIVRRRCKGQCVQQGW